MIKLYDLILINYFHKRYDYIDFPASIYVSINMYITIHMIRDDQTYQMILSNLIRKRYDYIDFPASIYVQINMYTTIHMIRHDQTV